MIMESKGYKVCNEGTAVCEAVPMVNMTDIAKENGILAKEVLMTVIGIRDHLFGAEPENCEKDFQPQCFKEELLRTNRDLKSAGELLHQIAGQLGI